MQLKLLIFFQSIANPVLDALAELFSVFGEIALPALLCLIIYWCVSKKKGFSVMMSIISAVSLTNFIKALVRFPRPFVRHPELISGKRLQTATGYSFPSGHAPTAASTYPAAARAFPKKWIKAAAVLLSLLVCLSRLYLGVHWPLDVATGFVIGMAAALLLSPLLERLWEKPSAFSYFSLIAGSLALIAALVLAFLLDEGRIDYTAWSDLCTMLSGGGAAMLGFCSERKLSGFDAAAGSVGKKILRALLGIATTALVAVLVSLIPLSHKLSTFAAVSLAVYWAVFLYPLAGRKLRLF